MNFFLATIVLFCSSSTLRSPCQIPIHRHGRSSSSLFVGGNGNTGKAGKGKGQGQGNATAGKAGKGQSNVNVGKAGKGQAKGNTTVGKAGKGQGNATAGKAVKGQGNAGGWPSTSGNPSGGRRSNAASKSKSKKAPTTLLEEVRLHEEKYSQQKASIKMIRRLVQENNVLEKKKKALEKKTKDLEKELNSRPNVPIPFQGHYKFGRDDVAALSQLISMYLFDKPDNIDSNKIYNCVRSYYNDLRMSYGDIPECYYEDVRMLLATCLASTWFSDDQLRNIEQWNKDHFGYRGYRNYAFLW